MPLARYVLEHQGKLDFPFRRYQIQRCWRGERPQEGRYREFTQADIDIIGRDTLGFDADIEVTEVMAEALSRLPVPPLTLHVNNRKLIQGFYLGLGLDDGAVVDVIRAVDKLDKVGVDGVRRLLLDQGLTEAQADQCLALAGIKGTDAGFADEVRALGVQHPQLDEGLDALVPRVEATAHTRSDKFSVVADLQIARGLDYYTGTGLRGSDGGSARHDVDLRRRTVRRAWPPTDARPIPVSGSRSASPGSSRRSSDAACSTPTGPCRRRSWSRCPTRTRASRVRAIARALRARGIPTEIAPSAAKYGRQIRHADRRGIPYVWFPGVRRRARQVKDIRSGDQQPADVDHLGATRRRPASAHRQPLAQPLEWRTPVIRTHDAGALRADHVGQTVTLAGWVARRRDHGGVAFIDLRDASGVAQVVIRDEEVAHPLRSEFCLEVDRRGGGAAGGQRQPQPADRRDRGRRRPTVEVLSESAALPFPVEEHHTTPVSEEVRLKHRYLDLRRPDMAANIRLRAEVTRIIREVMAEHDFLDIETPYLTRSTPEGARDFLVPVRLQPGSWYALPQSPQLFKQLLMVAGMERYFQIARCFRDEDFRADRQPEFTQLDVELSFCDAEDVQTLIEKLLARLWREVVGHEVTLPIPRMTYDEAMRRYGIDRPDLRFGCELVDFTEYFARHARSACSRRRRRRPPRRRRRHAGRCRRSRARSSTPGRTGPARAAPRVWPTCWCRRTASSAARSPRTCPRTSVPAWPRMPAPARVTASSSRQAGAPTRSACSRPPGSRWGSGAA